MQKPGRTLLLALSLLIIVSSANAAKPNIVHILADDLGIKDLHCYGRAEHSTPNLDKLAREAIRYTSS